MFDDLKQNTTAPADDMFAELDPVQAPVTSAAPEKPSALQSGKIKPASQTTMPPSSQGNQAPSAVTPNSMMVTDDRPGGMKKIIIVVVAIVLVAIMAAGVYYFILNKPKTPSEETVENTNTVVNQNVNVNVNNNINTVEAEPVDENDLDDDFDGLSNAQERELGTNPFEADSDNDALFDQDEVEIYGTDPLDSDTDNDELSDHDEIIVWRTDPLDPDSDGDGYQDGVEVNNGYNPLGDGLLGQENDNLLNTNSTN